MLRKVLLAFAAAAILGMVALAPTGASAHGWGWHGGFHHHGWGPGFGFGFAPTYGDVAECYWVRKPTYHGYRLVRVCD